MFRGPIVPGTIAVKQVMSHRGDIWVVDGAGRLWHGEHSAGDPNYIRWTLVPLPEAN